jgi:hypothetical protein
MRLFMIPRFLVVSTAHAAIARGAPARQAYRALARTIAVAAGMALAAGCGAVEAPASPDARSSDAAPGSCTQECLSEDMLRECTGGERTVACPLGCVTAEARCRAPVPSNDVAADEHLLGATEILTLATGVQAIIDTDIGSLTVGDQSLRAPGAGVVNSGIGFHYTAEGLSVFAVQGFVMQPGSSLRARGQRPLLILSAGDVEIAGTIDASGGCDVGATPQVCGGPGGGRGADALGSATGCGIGGSGASVSGKHGGGGGGGAAGQAGASGGAAQEAAGGSGGTACDASLVPLRGGAGGGRSGYTGGGGGGGGGGGAVQISSHTAIRLVSPAIIDAGGSGGEQGGSGSGGGGGGGGGILLEAPVLSIDGAILAANGGGGGGKSAPGADGPQGVEQALGGVGGGGLGGALAGAPTDGTAFETNFAGGGGGAIGLIQFRVRPAGYSYANTAASPAPVQLDLEVK